MTSATPEPAPHGAGVQHGPPAGPVAPAVPRESSEPLVRPTPRHLDSDDVSALLVGQSRAFTRADVSRLAGVSVIGARKFWHALGFPDVTSTDRPYTDADLRALRRIASLVRSGVLAESTALGLTRAFARTADRLAAWQVHLLAETLAEDMALHPPDDDTPIDEHTAQATARLVLDLADELEPMLVYAWRRHLNDAVARMLSDANPQGRDHGVVRAVGFADLVGFTTLVGHLTERDLASMVQRFESVATGVVTAHGGRVVKTVGDEVFFASRTAAPAAAIALDLIDALAEDSMLPAVRVGVSYGSVVSRLGDLFGTTVNRAARLTPMAHPGSVLVDDFLADALRHHPGFTLTPMRRRRLRGVGTVTPHVLLRSGALTRRGWSNDN